MTITADDREKSSGIIELLTDSGMDVIVRHLSCCDYIINNEISIERKTGRDFLISIIDGRLFRQAANMKRIARPLFLIEGNPFHIDMDFTPESIRGVILSLQVIWYIPVLFSKSKEDTCRIFEMIGEQEQTQTNLLTLRHGYRPKKLSTKQLYILQGLPNVGPLLAKRLLKHFGNVRNVMLADTESLLQIEGIGRERAREINRVLDTNR